MARKESSKDIIYLFVNARDHNVISYGISFQPFIQSLKQPINNILLLNHSMIDSEIHLHTQLSYVPGEQFEKITESIVRNNRICWVDFDDILDLDSIDGQELAELLYLGHLKKHLSLPFFQKLNNRFVYLTDNDGWMNKIYYRNWNDFYDVLSYVISNKLSDIKAEKSLIGFWRKKIYPSIDPSVLQHLRTLLTEGVVFSFQNVNQSKGVIEIPFWIIGDYYDMYEMEEVFDSRSSEAPAGILQFDKKQKNWTIKVLAKILQ